MNAWMNPINHFNTTQYLNPADPYRVFRKQGDIPKPSEIFVFLDENPGSVNDGFFLNNAVRSSSPTGTNTWCDRPACYHNNASGLAFADGHALIRKWTDPVVLKQGSGNGLTATAGIGDWWWLWNATTASR